jgi:hypothetical protein
MGSQPRPEHDTFDEFIEMERARLQEHASGKMANALGHALPDESQEELDRIAAEDQHLAQEGLVKLKVGERVYHKHIDELTREDRKARIAAEREEVAWLKKRLGLPEDSA